MATHPEIAIRKKSKAVVLGRSAATGRFVLKPVVTKKSKVSEKRIATAVKNALSKKK